MTTPTTPCQACEKMRRLVRDSLICHCNHASEYVCRRCAALALPCSCGTEGKTESGATNLDFLPSRGVEQEVLNKLDQSDPKPAPTPRADAVFRDDQTGVLPSNWTMADFARQLERELADHHALVVYYERKWKEVRDELASVKLASQQPRWIPYSERAPTKADGVALDPGNNTLVVFRRNKYGEIHLARWDYETGKAQHWCRIVLPPELEPEPQSWGDVREGEMDKAAFEKWRTSKPASDEPITQYDLREAWRAALAHARGESK